MAYLVRKININNWPDGEHSFLTSKEELRADSITSDLRTTNDTLSWWRVEDETELEHVGTSIVSILKSKQNNIRIIALPYEEIEKKFDLKNTPQNGDTAILKFKQRHYDICNLNYGSLGDLGYIIAKETSNIETNLVLKINVNEAIVKIKEMIEKGEADKDLLGAYIKEKLNIS